MSWMSVWLSPEDKWHWHNGWPAEGKRDHRIERSAPLVDKDGDEHPQTEDCNEVSWAKFPRSKVSEKINETNGDENSTTNFLDFFDHDGKKNEKHRVKKEPEETVLMFNKDDTVYVGAT